MMTTFFVLAECRKGKWRWEIFFLLRFLTDRVRGQRPQPCHCMHSFCSSPVFLTGVLHLGLTNWMEIGNTRGRIFNLTRFNPDFRTSAMCQGSPSVRRTTSSELSSQALGRSWPLAMPQLPLLHSCQNWLHVCQTRHVRLYLDENKKKLAKSLGCGSVSNLNINLQPGLYVHTGGWEEGGWGHLPRPQLSSCTLVQNDCKFVKTNANEQSMYLLYTANIARLVIFSMYVMWNMKMDQTYVK